MVIFPQGAAVLGHGHQKADFFQHPQRSIRTLALLDGLVRQFAEELVAGQSRRIFAQGPQHARPTPVGRRKVGWFCLDDLLLPVRQVFGVAGEDGPLVDFRPGWRHEGVQLADIDASQPNGRPPFAFPVSGRRIETDGSTGTAVDAVARGPTLTPVDAIAADVAVRDRCPEHDPQPLPPAGIGCGQLRVSALDQGEGRSPTHLVGEEIQGDQLAPIGAAK